SLRVWPDQSVVEQADTRLPEVIFAGGVVGAFLLALAVRLAERARQREHKARAAELALQESEHRFRSLAKQGHDIVAIVTPEREVKYVSPSIRRQLGYADADVENSVSDLYIHPDHLPRVVKSIEAALRIPARPATPLNSGFAMLMGRGASLKRSSRTVLM